MKNDFTTIQKYKQKIIKELVVIAIFYEQLSEEEFEKIIEEKIVTKREIKEIIKK